MFRRLFFLAGAALAAGAAEADTIENLYNQPYGSNCAAYCWTSHYSNSVGGFVTYDDFTLGQSAMATSVAWQGFYLDSDAPTALAPSNTDYWRLEIQSDEGQIISQFDVTTPSATVMGMGTFSGNPATAYSFSADLPSPVVLTAGTKYWFSATSIVEGDYLPKFIWSGASATFDNISVQVQNDGLAVQKPGDRAFQIYGTPAVPEPASWAMMICGMAAVGGAARMRRKTAIARPRSLPKS